MQEAQVPLEMSFSSQAACQAGLERIGLPLVCGVSTGNPLHGSAILSRLCGHAIAEFRVDACQFAQRSMKGDEAALLCVWQLTGRSQVSGSLLESGSWTVLDPAGDCSIRPAQGARLLILQLPRERCAPAARPLAGQAIRTHGPAHIACAALGAMLRSGAGLSEESAGVFHESIVTLVERALSLELAARGLSVRSDRLPDLQQIQAYIRENLSKAELSVDKLAQAFAVSRRTIYKLFEPLGVAPHAFIQSAKLERARTLLSSRQWSRMPIARIGQQCGFVDPAHFSRAFRAQVGVAPTEWRMAAA